MYDVHVSGHACQEEQKLMLSLTKPKYFLPVHGEYKQLKKHALTAASLGIPTSNILIAENGSNVILSQDEIKLGEPVTAGAVMVDGLGVGMELFFTATTLGFFSISFSRLMVSAVPASCGML